MKFVNNLFEDFYFKCHFYCSEDEQGKKVEVLDPQADAKPGDRAYFENYENSADSPPDPILNPKKKIWEKLQVSYTQNVCYVFFFFF